MKMNKKSIESYQIENSKTEEKTDETIERYGER